MRSPSRHALMGLVVLAGVGGLRADLVDSDPPPRNIPVETVPRDELPKQRHSPAGLTALATDPDRWKHAETPNYLLHFRRITEARKVARELEFNLWFVAGLLDADREDYAGKAHAYIFEDDEEWAQFKADAGLPDHAGSVAIGDDLFLNVRSRGNTRRFDSNLLAHEATHAVVSRLYPDRRWPLWLNEGLAEFVSAAGVAERRNQTLGRHLEPLPEATIPFEELIRTTGYPESDAELRRYYQSSERVVRFLMTELPPERFPRFVEALLDGGDVERAILEAYDGHVAGYGDFLERLREFDTGG